MKVLMKTVWFLFCVLASLRKINALEKIRLHGLGATFPASVYENWLSVYDYSRRKYVDLDTGYVAIGSREGIDSAVNGNNSTDFLASDILMKEKDYEDNPDLHMLPVIAG